ncbi:MAG: O-antigen ligase family protein [Elusimicrobiota bacterium]|nr:O-antigen ligase family protein [Elusimicrobiota bacterium]
MRRYTLDQLIFFSLCLFAFTVIFSVTVVEAALFLALGLLLAKKKEEKTLGAVKPALTGHPLFLPWMIYLCVCLLTSLTAYYPLKGLGQLNSDFLKYVCLSTLLLGVKKEHLSGLSGFYTAGAALAAAIGIAQVAHLFPSVYGSGAVRANALMNAVRYSEVMTIAFLLLLGRLVIPAKETFKHEQLFYKLAALPVFVSIILSQTRGAYLGLITGVLTMIYFVTPSRKKMAAYAGIMVVTAALIMTTNPVMRSRMLVMAGQRTADVSENSPAQGLDIRMGLWKLGAKMFKAHPVLGVGPDNIKKVFKKFQPVQIGYFETWGSLHSLYIHQAAERGSLGLGALLLLFGAMLLFAFRRFQAARSPYTLWPLCALPAYYVMNLTEITFQHVHTAFAILMALSFSAVAEEEKL